MIPTKQEYEAALKTVSVYENHHKQIANNLFNKNADKAKIEIEEYFKKTFIKEITIETFPNTQRIEITSLDPEFDENYDGEFDDDMDKIAAKYGKMNIYFESDNYGK